MKVLFIGGSGVISSGCSMLAVQKGIELFHLNRGRSIGKRPIEGIQQIIADIRKPETVEKAISGMFFDAVVEWIAFTPEHIQTDINLFKGKTNQYVFISSASAYQTPPKRLPVTEETPLENPFWQYSRDKIACEKLLEKAYVEFGFPYTTVRPSHTYDRTLLPFDGGYTVLKRIFDEKPVVIHGDGSSLWTITHNTDFAKGFIGLLGHKDAIAEAFHITSNELISWRGIYEAIADAAGKKLKPVFVPSETIAKHDAEWGASLLGDKTHSMLFDNSKIKRLVPEFDCKIKFAQGAEEMVAWHLQNEDNLTTDKRVNELFNRLIDYQEK